MNRKEALFFSALSLVLEISTFNSLGATVGNAPIVGVKLGDFNEYSYAVSLFSNDTYAMLSTQPDYQWLSTIDTCRVSVENISGANITAQFVYTFKNGTKETITRWADLATNQVSDSEVAHGYFMALNGTIFNETLARSHMSASMEVRSYLGESVEVRHISGGFVNGTVTWPINGTEHALLYNYTLDMYLNNSTGTLLEYTETASNKNGTYFSVMTLHGIIVQSSAIPQFPLLLILLVITAAIVSVAAIILVAMAYRKKVCADPKVDLKSNK